MDFPIKMLPTYLNNMDFFFPSRGAGAHRDTSVNFLQLRNSTPPQLLLKTPRTIRTMQGPTKLYAAFKKNGKKRKTDRPI